MNVSEDYLIRYADLKNTPTYQKWYIFYKTLFENDEEFSSEINNIVFQLFPNSSFLTYFLHELPLIINITSILNISSSSVIYHQKNVLVDYLFNIRKIQEKNQGFSILSF